MMEEFYIEELLEHSKRLPVIKQFLLLLLDYAQLEKYCFQLFGSKRDSTSLMQYAIVMNIDIPWSVLFTDKYKWLDWLWIVPGKFAQQCAIDTYCVRSDDGESFDKILGNMRFSSRYIYMFTTPEIKYIQRILKRGEVFIYGSAILPPIDIFEDKQKIDCLRELYKSSFL